MKMHRNLFVVLFAATCVLLVVACKNTTPSARTTNTDSATTPASRPDTATVAVNDTDSDHAIYYVAIADSGSEYAPLDRLMYTISGALHINVDTMGRYYNTTKKQIVLPDDNEDELYRGEYYPRREGADFLSVEYTALYDTSASEHNMCVVAGLFDTKKSADSILKLISPTATKAFVIKASIYEGCLH